MMILNSKNLLGGEELLFIKTHAVPWLQSSYLHAFLMLKLHSLVRFRGHTSSFLAAVQGTWPCLPQCGCAALHGLLVG